MHCSSNVFLDFFHAEAARYTSISDQLSLLEDSKSALSDQDHTRCQLIKQSRILQELAIKSPSLTKEPDWPGIEFYTRKTSPLPPVGSRIIRFIVENGNIK